MALSNSALQAIQNSCDSWNASDFLAAYQDLPASGHDIFWTHIPYSRPPDSTLLSWFQNNLNRIRSTILSAFYSAHNSSRPLYQISPPHSPQDETEDEEEESHRELSAPTSPMPTPLSPIPGPSGVQNSSNPDQRGVTRALNTEVSLNCVQHWRQVNSKIQIFRRPLLCLNRMILKTL